MRFSWEFFRWRLWLAFALIGLATPVLGRAFAAEPLASWHDAPAKRAILDFVARTTSAASPDFLSPADRIATFDNDGTLWPEQPLYVQLAFALDRVRALAPNHPEWNALQPFQAALANDLGSLAASGEQGLADLLMATHANMTTAEFEAIVIAWFAEARHPRFKRPYSELAYQPMVELLQYLRDHGFKTYIVSGGGIEFMRPVTLAAYGIPPEQVIGSSIQTKYELRNGTPVLLRLPAIDFVDDKAGKPVGIHKFIGKRPVLAFGNSAGDREMLEWSSAGPGLRLMLLLLHDDPVREYAYGPAEGLDGSKFGAFPQSLMDDAQARDWRVVRMKSDWRRIFSTAE